MLTSTLRAEKSLELQEVGTCSNSETSSRYDVASRSSAPFVYLLTLLLHGHFYSPILSVPVVEEIQSKAWGLAACFHQSLSWEPE